MKFLTYVFRNARRNKVRTLLTIASTAISLFLMMILFSFFEVNDSVAAATRPYNRILSLNSQGFSGKVPYVRVREIAEMDGVRAASPLNWFGGKFNNQVMPFAQFGVDADSFFTIYDELTIPPDQLKAFQDDKAGCVVGRKLAQERNFKVGDPLPLQGDIYPIDLALVVRGIYDGPNNTDLRMCVFHWSYFDDAIKASSQAVGAGNAGAIVIKLKSNDTMTTMCRAIDTAYANTENPMRTQTEEAFTKFFVEMLGDLKGMVRWIGAAVLLSLLLVGANALAMALRERTTEVAVLKAIGFSKQLVLFLILAEAMIVTGLGGVIGALGSKLLFDVFDLSKYASGLLPFFFVPWATALFGLTASLLIGFLSGFFPALRAARTSVVNGLRKVV